MAALQVVGPRRLLRLPLQARDERAQPLGVRLDDALVESRLAQILAHVPRRRVVGFLRLRLKVHVREHAAAHVIARAQQIQADLGVHAVDVAAHPRLKRHVAVCLQEERVEEHLTELPVAHPWLALGALVERRDVDEHRRRAFPLEVVGRGVLQPDALIQRGEHEVELQERRVPEHLERPFVRVRHERQLLVFEHARPTADPA